jgi:hypothetical protein
MEPVIGPLRLRRNIHDARCVVKICKPTCIFVKAGNFPKPSSSKTFGLLHDASKAVEDIEMMLDLLGLLDRICLTFPEIKGDGLNG